jgi:glycosyltransferase involved in cell wall biosynthesis
MTLGKLFSVVTVCRNAKSEIRDTLESVITQNFDDFEYVVMDGNSTDGTQAVIGEYREHIAHFTSEKDGGIYDAMNKSVLRCSGKYVLFMNAGDRFLNASVLKQVSESLNDYVADVVYGDTEVFYPNFGTSRLIKAKHLGKLPFGMIASHQSIFVKRDFLINHPFDISERLAADYKALCVAVNSGRQFAKLDLCVSRVSAGGVSDINQAAVFDAWSRIGAHLKQRPFLAKCYLGYMSIRARIVCRIKNLLPLASLRLIHSLKR